MVSPVSKRWGPGHEGPDAGRDDDRDPGVAGHEATNGRKDGMASGPELMVKAQSAPGTMISSKATAQKAATELAAMGSFSLRFRCLPVNYPRSARMCSQICWCLTTMMEESTSWMP